jgi:hypothetical protein
MQYGVVCVCDSELVIVAATIDGQAGRGELRCQRTVPWAGLMHCVLRWIFVYHARVWM